MGAKILATITTIIGSIAVIYTALEAFGIELTQGQQTAITGLAGLFVTLAGLWFHPSVPIGTTEEKP